MPTATFESVRIDTRAMFKLLDDMLADKVILTIEEGEC